MVWWSWESSFCFWDSRMKIFVCPIWYSPSSKCMFCKNARTSSWELQGETLIQIYKYFFVQLYNYLFIHLIHLISSKSAMLTMHIYEKHFFSQYSEYSIMIIHPFTHPFQIKSHLTSVSPLVTVFCSDEWTHHRRAGH